MRGKGPIVAAVLVFVLLMVLSALLSQDPGAGGSALSRASYGWLGARRLLEKTGITTAILDTSPRGRAIDGVLVVTLPWQHVSLEERFEWLDEHVRSGGTLVLGFSGDALAATERELTEALGIPREPARPAAPLNPLKWREYVREVWSLRPAAELTGLASPRVFAMPVVPRAPAQSQIFFRNEAGRAVVFAYERGKGHVLVMPSELLSNGRLAEAGSADWLMTLARSFPGPWTFDEYHHGLIAATVGGTAEAGTEKYMDLYLAQLVFLYVLAMLALWPRFGPAWREPPVVSGSVGSFLVGLGGLHERGQHHHDAAAVLVQRAEELDRRFTPPRDAASEGQKTPADFLKLARRIGRSQWRRNA